MTHDILRKLRADRGLTREELAKELGCSAGAIVQWETDPNKPGSRSIPDWVAEKMYRTLPIELTIDELGELYDICRELGIGMHQLVAEALRPKIQERIRQREEKATRKPVEYKSAPGGIGGTVPERRVAQEHDKDNNEP